jgi:1-deoxy-D-xylulose-5-phosphate synthase
VTGRTPGGQAGHAAQLQDVFGQTMVKLCQKDNSIVGITAAMPSGTGLKALEKAMPRRYYDVGIAEEHAVHVRRRHGDDGFSSGVRDLLDLFATGLRLHRA